MQTNPLSILRQLESTRPGRCVLSGFESFAPRFRTPQNSLLSWLTEAHVRAGGEPAVIEEMFDHCSASPEHIAYRGHELADFTHQRWDEMTLFGPQGSDLAEKTAFFDERVNTIFETIYPLHAAAPRGIVHVTCTGYTSPSGAQRVVSLRNWGQQTQVMHAYHMGCYAAHPAIRIARGLLAESAQPGLPVDVVHTELCSLHLDPSRHTPSDVVIQSLFSDGYIKYQVSSAAGSEENQPGLEILAAGDEIVPDSTDAMAWSTGSRMFTMALSKDVPLLLASALPRFLSTMFQSAGLDWAVEKPKALFAIHPGGPRIIELTQRILGLSPAQVLCSRQVLRDHGNMSSATLPHIWQKMLQDPGVPNGTRIVSIGAGPGLTLSGMLFQKR